MTDLIALDWGTSSLRAFLMDPEGRVRAERASAHGIQNLPEPGGREGYEAAFTAICGDWHAEDPARPVVAGGMVGSAQGWVEAPYVRCPADLGTLAAHPGEVALPGGGTGLIVPGVLLDEVDRAPDVIRGEEVQIAGALATRPDWAAQSVFVLPGTHSKWVDVAQGTITDFATYMTGEVFAVLRRHSILGRLMTEEAVAPEVSDAAFREGLERARAGAAGDLLNQIFGTRTMGLTKRLPGAALSDYLSGLLIGNELVSAAARMAERGNPPVVMIGDGALCRRYLTAFGVFGIDCAAQLNNTAPEGLFRFAVARGLMAAPSGA